MAIDEVPREENIVVRQSSGPWVIVFAVLGLLVLGEIYTLSKIGSISSVQAEQASLRTQVQKSNDQLAAKLSNLEDANAQQLDALRTDLDTASQKMSRPDGKQLARARAMVAKLEKETQAQNDALKQEMAKNNEQMGQQISSVSQDVAATKSDLGTTKQTVTTLQSDLGMARSGMGTLIARNHDDIETLRKLGQRNYYEFTLTKNQEQTVAGVGLILKKTNVKRHRFNLNLMTNDMAIPKDNRTVLEPVFFATGTSKEFYELVVDKVAQDTITGYISTPKYSQPELAASTTPPSGQ
ncbi:MAG TPA: hypothetical protein VMT20_23420 [Terriglobia bacterium]|nr:hypothetical protein [Terriglobia bacterium]